MSLVDLLVAHGKILIEVLVLNLLLLIALLLTHLLLVGLHHCLTTTEITTCCHSRPFLDSVFGNHLEVSLLLQLITIIADFHLLGDDSKKPGAIERGVADLGLERETLDLFKVQVFHLNQLRDRLESIFKGEHILLGDIAERSGKDRPVCRQSCGIFISELESLVQLDLGLDLRGNYWKGQDIGEVLGEGNWAHALDLATGELSKLAQGVDLALVAFDAYDVDRDASLLSNLADALVELFNFGELRLCLGLIECTQADVGKTVSANDDGRAWLALARKAD